ncbi:MAG: CRISPR-associated endonuclease Cas1 [Fimbriimonadales bacterium]|nr:CRISPR-associated endonuclease Cas1 [Fimbriimonadales bacterium]
MALQDIFIEAHQSELRSEGGLFRVVRQGDTLGAVPEGLVRGVWLLPGCSLSRRALDRLAANRTPCAFLSESGRLQACLLYPETVHLEARLGQVRAFTDPQMRLGFASRIVAAKLASQRLFHRSLQKRGLVAALPKSLGAAPTAPDLETLRGVEGAAARDAFSLLMEAAPTQWRSPGRSYRPPTDPANALLSLGYSLATSATLAFLLAEGLDPFLGMLHQPHHSMPALAVDLVEPFRAPLAEAWFLRVARSGMLQPSDFEPAEQGGCRLANRDLFRACVRSFAEAWTSDLVGCRLGAAKTARDAMLAFVRSAREAFSAGDPERILLPR